MSILLLLALLLVPRGSHADFVIELPIPADVDSVSAGQLSGWATFACPSGSTYWGYPSGPGGDPPAMRLTFFDHGDGCLDGPWWS